MAMFSYRDETCADCRRLTSGDCGRHGSTLRFTNEPMSVCPASLPALIDAVRAQGRAEILDLVAKLPSPIGSWPGKDQKWCNWCHGNWKFNDEHPDNGCLFVRAQQAASDG